MIDQVLESVSLSFVDIFNFCVFIAFTCCYAYQLFYVFVTLTRKPPVREAKKPSLCGGYFGAKRKCGYRRLDP